MTITLRQITRRADGGDIVRTRRLEDPLITIGRAADCGIILPDLAVARHHARLGVRADGKVLIEGLGGETFLLDGKAASQAVIDPSTGATIGFGDHRLAIEAGAGPGELTVTVTQGAAAHEEEAARVFSIRPGFLTKRRMAWIAAAIIVLVSLAWPIAVFQRHETIFAKPDAQWSIGHLSGAHAFLENNCQACHQKAFVAVRDDACLSCHAAARDPAALLQTASAVRAAGGLTAPLFIADHANHARLLKAVPPPPGDTASRVRAAIRKAFGRPDDRCVTCHGEHQGPTGFRPPDLAGLPPIPTLKVVNSCTDCHAALRRRLADTLLIDTPDWARHPNFRPLVTVGIEAGKAHIVRAALNDHPSEASGLTFSHAQHLQASGGVARMAQTLGVYGAALTCADCHRPAANGPGFEPVGMVRDCEACHSLAIGEPATGIGRLPHGEPAQVAAAIRAFYARLPAPAVPDPARRRPGISAEGARVALATSARPDAVRQAERAVQAAFLPGGVCAGCHVIAPQTAGAPVIAPVRLTSRYLMRGTFDHRTAGHRPGDPGGPACASCHAAESSSQASDLLLPSISQCATCHGKDKTQVKLAAPADCAECHSYHAPDLPARKPSAPAKVAGNPFRELGG